MRFLLLIALFVSGGAVAEPPATNLTSICAINKDRAAFIGKVVTVAATYATDSAHFEYLMERACGAQGVLDIGFKDPARATSVERFYAASQGWCARHNAHYLCNIRGDVVAQGTVIAGQDGRLKLNLLSVLSYNFKDER
jgi:hypothetical protein